MTKREFLRMAGLTSLGLAVMPLYSCQSSDNEENNLLVPNDEKDEPVKGIFALPELGFAYSALAPNIDAQTMEIHYSKHHQGYVDKLNKAVKESNIENKSLKEILSSVSNKEEENDLRNNAGGHYNHTLYWEILLPGGSKAPSGNLLNQINADFGSFEAFKTEFSKNATDVFGSGWAWLCVDENKKLFISKTPNQDNPLMEKIVDKTGTPILGVDVWEHAYYLKYQNERKKYVASFIDLINWDVVSKKFEVS